MGKPYSGHRLSMRSAIGKNAEAGKPLNLLLPDSYLIKPLTEQERLNQRVQQMLQQPGQQRRLAQERDLLANIKDLFKDFPREIKIENKQGLLQLTMGGAIAELKEGTSKAGVKVGFDGKPEVYSESQSGKTKVRVSSSISKPMQFQVTHQSLSFTGTLTPDYWEVKFSIGSLVPDINKLPTIFRQGENSMRSTLSAVGGLDQTNVSTIKKAVEPHIQPIKDSIEAASQVAKIRHRVNFSLNAKGPTQNPRGGSEEGLQVGVALTITF